MDAASCSRRASSATIGKGARSRGGRGGLRGDGIRLLRGRRRGGRAARAARDVGRGVAWPELGTEALVRVTLDRFPAFVAIDARGRDLYAEALCRLEAAVSGRSSRSRAARASASRRRRACSPSACASAGRRRRRDARAGRDAGGRPHPRHPARPVVDDDRPRPSCSCTRRAARSSSATVIVPALERGDTSSCATGSSTPSTAYQGYGRGLGLGTVERAQPQSRPAGCGRT